jgi:hypothetical protein
LAQTSLWESGVGLILGVG